MPPLENGSAKNKIIVIGAGPVGLATGLAHLKEGYTVTLLESNTLPGQGLSWRADSNPYATMHLGFLQGEGTERAELCQRVHKMLKDYEVREDKSQIDPTMEALLANSFKPANGKLFVSMGHSPEDIADLHKYEPILDRMGIEYTWVEGEEIKTLNEELVADAGAVISLPDGRIINIQGYVKALEQAFLAAGGEIRYSHEVLGFEVPILETKTKGTGVIGRDADGNEVTLYAHAVKICAGLGTPSLTEAAENAVKASIERGLGAVRTPDKTPAYYYNDIYVAARNDDMGIGPLVACHPYYLRMTASGLDTSQTDNVDPDKVRGSVGPHPYMSFLQYRTKFHPNGLHSMNMGPFNIDRDEKTIGNKGEFPEFTDARMEQIQYILPNADVQNEYHLHFVGSEISPIVDGKPVFQQTWCEDFKTGFNVYASGAIFTPALTVAPVVGKDQAEVQRLLDLLDEHFAIEPMPLRRMEGDALQHILEKTNLATTGNSKNIVDAFNAAGIEIFLKVGFDHENPANIAETIKKRTAYGIVREAIKAKQIKRGTRVYVESGGSYGGILAAMGQKLGFETVIVACDTKYTNLARVPRLAALGANGALISSEAGAFDTVAMAMEFTDKDKEKGIDAHFTNQFGNKWNSWIQKVTTGQEIPDDVRDAAGNLPDACISFIGEGSSGSATGIGHAVEGLPNFTVFAVKPGIINHAFSGTGPGFTPKILDLELVRNGKIVPIEVSDENVLNMSMEMAAAIDAEMGLPVGPSTGLAAYQMVAHALTLLEKAETEVTGATKPRLSLIATAADTRDMHSYVTEEEEAPELPAGWSRGHRPSDKYLAMANEVAAQPQLAPV